MIHIWTDGCCGGEWQGGGTAGGWAYVAVNAAGGVVGRESGAVYFADAGRMELLAVLEALRAFNRVDEAIEIVTDAQYISHGFGKLAKWRRNDYRYMDERRRGRPIRDADLWRSAWTYWRNRPVKVRRVSRGIHALNVEADHAAKQAMRRAVGPRTRSEQRLMKALDGALRSG